MTFILASGRLALSLFELCDPPLRLHQILASLEFAHELFVEGERFGLSLLFHQRLAEIVIDGIASGIPGILGEQCLEPVDCPRVPTLPEIEIPDHVVVLAQTIARLTEFRTRLRHEAAVRIAINERL